MMHATSMAEEQPPSMDKLLGFDGTEHADAHISPEEYDWDEHK